MQDAVYSVGTGLCWAANTFTGSMVCATQAHAISAGYATFAFLALLGLWTLMKHLNRA